MIKKKKNNDPSIESLNKLQDLKDSILTEIEQLRSKRDSLHCEIEGIKISIASNEKFIHSYEENKSNILDMIQTNTQSKEKLLNDINILQLKIKAVKSDEFSSKGLNQNLKNDLYDIIEEKKLLSNRIMEIQDGLAIISKEKEKRIPSLKKCNDIIKRLNSSLKVAHNHMEVSMVFNEVQGH